MKKSIVVMFVAFFLSISFFSKAQVSASGKIISDDRNLSDFSTVSSAGSTDVFITQGSSYKVTVKGSDNLVADFETLVADGVLHLSYRVGKNIRHDDVKIYVTLPALKGLSLSGSGNVTVNGDFTGNDFETTVSGSGNIKIEKMDASNAMIRISGSGNINAFGLTTKTADIHISGSGNAELDVTDKLEARISGSGNVFYKSSPSVSSHISGSGSIQKKNS